jgi:hypothetical protein
MRFLLLSLAFLCLATAQISLPLRRSTGQTPQLRTYASAPIANEYNVSARQFLYTVDIGNPVQNFTLMLTSSFAVRFTQCTWVFSSSCTTSRPDANKLNSTESSTYHSGETSYQLSLGEDKIVDGILSQDDITLRDVTAQQANSILATSEPVDDPIYKEKDWDMWRSMQLLRSTTRKLLRIRNSVCSERQNLKHRQVI